ncbi:MAG: phage minor head protein [Treponemataceae bacterium]
MTIKPKAAIKFLNKKYLVPTEKWDDLQHGEHAHCFTVAHSIHADILTDIFTQMQKAVAGDGFNEFKKNIKNNPAIIKWSEDLESLAKEGKIKIADVKKGTYLDWRIKTMYHTNMRTAYAASHYRKMLSVSHLRPYWQYQQVERKTKRKEHSVYDGKIWKADNSVWDIIYPPNGWNCDCYIKSLTEQQAQSEGTIQTQNIEIKNIPSEWAYNVGKEAFVPNFQKYKLPIQIKAAINKAYAKDMKNASLSKNEFRVLCEQLNNPSKTDNDFNVISNVFNLGVLSFEQKNAVDNSVKKDIDVRLATTTGQIFHALRFNKNAVQKVGIKNYGDVWQTINDCDAIYKQGNEFLFVKKINKTTWIKVVFGQEKQKPLALRSFGLFDDIKNKIEFEGDLIWQK